LTKKLLYYRLNIRKLEKEMFLMLRQISKKRQITLPPEVLKDTGSKPGDYLEVLSEKGKIILIPKTVEDKFLTDEEWDKLDKLVKKQRRQGKYTLYTNAEEAKKHSRKLMKQ